tara:strand:+ start:347 stop:1597 length:1251 start_codon:yes stop_codon:yes gene_type:complete
MGYKRNQGKAQKFHGLSKPEDLILLSKNIDAAIKRLESDIAAATKGIDPKDKKSIEFALSQLNEKYKGIGGKAFSRGDDKKFALREGGLPPELHDITYLLRSAPDKQSRSLQIFSRINPGTMWPGGGQHLSISGKRDFTRKLAQPREIGANPYGFLDTLYTIQRQINDIQGTRYSGDIDPNVLKRFNIQLDLSNTNNVYYLKNKDLQFQGAPLNEYYTSREKYKKDNPLLYAARPGDYKGNLNANNNYYRANAKNEIQSPYNTLGTNRGNITGDPNKGRDRWTGRNSGRSYHQANADTRALLISEGANPAMVRNLNNDVLERFRISGPAAQSGKNMTLLNNGNLIRLKLNGNNSGTYAGSSYASGYNSSTAVESTVKPKEKLVIPEKKEEKPSLSIGQRLSNFEKKLSNSFSDPLE